MNKKKNQNRKNELAKKNAIESLRFQTHFGLKQMGCEDGDIFQRLAETEMSFISELNLAQDILDIKKLVDGVRANLQVNTTSEKGDFCTSISQVSPK